MDAEPRVTPLASREGEQPLQVARISQSRHMSEGAAYAPRSEGQDNARTSRVVEKASGVDWSTYETGRLLFDRTYAQLYLNGGAISASSVRNQYVDGATYVMRALPNDLEPVEFSQLQNALAGKLQADWRSPSPRRAKGNLLSRSITFLMLRCAFFLSFILPILMDLLDRFLRYEREHHVVQKLFVGTGQAIESVGEQGLDLKDAIVRFSQRRLGSTLFAGFIWIAEGVVQGVSEGAGRSAVIVGSAVALRSDEVGR